MSKLRGVLMVNLSPLTVGIANDGRPFARKMLKGPRILNLLPPASSAGLRKLLRRTKQYDVRRFGSLELSLDQAARHGCTASLAIGNAGYFDVQLVR